MLIFIFILHQVSILVSLKIYYKFENNDYEQRCSYSLLDADTDVPICRLFNGLSISVFPILGPALNVVLGWEQWAHRTGFTATKQTTNAKDGRCAISFRSFVSCIVFYGTNNYL